MRGTANRDNPSKTHVQSGVARRRLLKRLGVAGVTAGTAAAMPKQWVKPVVDTVLLPGHAQATPAGGGANTGNGNRSFSASGSWVVPGQVTSVQIILRGGSGGGGGGGGAASDGGLRVNGARGSDGAAGELVTRVISVTPGETFNIVIGQPGIGGAPGIDSPDPDGAVGFGGAGGSGGAGGPSGGNGVNGGNGQAPANVFIDSTGGGGGGGGGGGATSVSRGGTILSIARGGDGGLGGQSSTGRLTSNGGLGGRGGDPDGSGLGGGGGGTGGSGSSSVIAGGVAAGGGGPGVPGGVTVTW